MNREPLKEQTKNLDSKGRITLGRKFANRTATVQYWEDGEIVIRFSQVIPNQEAWLYQNEQALSLVQQGLDEAKKGQLSPPNLQKAFSFADEIPEEE